MDGHLQVLVPIVDTCGPLVKTLVSFVTATINGDTPDPSTIIAEATRLSGANVLKKHTEKHGTLTDLVQVAHVMGEGAAHLHMSAQITALAGTAVVMWKYCTSNAFTEFRLKKIQNRETLTAVLK